MRRLTHHPRYSWFQQIQSNDESHQRLAFQSVAARDQLRLIHALSGSIGILLTSKSEELHGKNLKPPICEARFFLPLTTNEDRSQSLRGTPNEISGQSRAFYNRWALGDIAYRCSIHWRTPFLLSLLAGVAQDCYV
jgi:hypothetical protein